MLTNLWNRLQGGQPRSLVIVRPATVGGFISGAADLAWLIISSLATKIIYILALIVGVVVGLSQVIFVVSVDVLNSYFTSPSKKTIGDDGDGAKGKPLSSSEKLDHQLDVVDDLRPRHLFVVPHGGEVDEQRGTEMHTPDDWVGPGTVENLLVPVENQAEISPAIQKAAPIPGATEEESEQVSEVTEPTAVLLPSPPVQSMAPTTQVEEIAEIPAANSVTAEAVTPQPGPTVVEPQITSTEAISPVDRLTAAELEDKKVGIPEPEEQSFTAPETPKIDSMGTLPPAAFEKPPQKQDVVPAPISAGTGAAAPATAAAPAAPIEQDTEAASGALPKAEGTPVAEPVEPAVVQEEQKGTLKKKNRGPLHKVAKEIRKVFR